MIRWLLHLLRTPSDFPRDPWGYVRNQVGHALVFGAGGAWIWLRFTDLAAAAALLTPAIYLGTIELIQRVRYGASREDSIEDGAHVAIAAATVATGAWLVIPGHLIFILAGALARANARKDTPP